MARRCLAFALTNVRLEIADVARTIVSNGLRIDASAQALPDGQFPHARHAQIARRATQDGASGKVVLSMVGVQK